MKNLLLLFTLVFALTLNANNDPNDFNELKKLEGIFSGKELAKYPHFESAKEAVVSYLEDDGIRWSSMVIITDVKEKGDVVFFKVHHPVSAYENGKDVTYLKHFDVSMEYNSSVKEWMSIRDVR